MEDGKEGRGDLHIVIPTVSYLSQPIIIYVIMQLLRGKPIQGCSDGVVSELLSIYILIEKKDLAIEPLP